MHELYDLMDDVRADLTAVRWPSGDELRRRVRRRRQRVIASAAAMLVIAVTAGVAVAARPDREPPPPPAVTPTVDAGPVEIPSSALLRPEDVGAGPDTQDDGMDAFRPIELQLDHCLRQRGSQVLSLSTRYSRKQTLLLGTAAERPARPFLLQQGVYRLPTPQVATFLRDLRAAIESCDGFTMTGDLERPGGKVPARSEHRWSIVANGFAGDESILVRNDIVVRNAKTGEVIGQSSNMLSAYLRVGDLVTTLSPRAGTSADELRRIAATAAQRMCVAAHPAC